MNRTHCKCGTSTGICGSITRGTGKLDFNGYWEHPCPHGNAFSEYKVELVALSRCPRCGSKDKDTHYRTDAPYPQFQMPCPNPWHGAATEPSERRASVASKPKTEPEDVEFNTKWHLASANRPSIFGQYQRPGETGMTGNVGAWYDQACYWKTECEKLRAEAASKLREKANGTNAESQEVQADNPTMA